MAASAPKLFISYSWSTPSHEAWVISLASELRQSGVDVILDKWDLKEGHDAIAFMEKMVADPDIQKVLMIIDRAYAEKADGRSGGVGTETQIISKEVYDSQEQTKFVAAAVEKDDLGKPYLPVYYRSRIYIDFTESERYAENFEKLLRWVYNKPFHLKPELGKAPEFIASENPIQLGTTAHFKRAIDALRNNKPHAVGALGEYLEALSAGIEKFRIDKASAEFFDDAVVKSIDEFLPYRGEFIEILITLSKYHISDDVVTALHRFFESILHYNKPPKNIGQYNESDFDNFQFITHELYLYAIAVPLKYEKFDFAKELIERQFFIAGNSDYGRDAMASYAVFRYHLKSLEYRNSRLGLRRTSLEADFLKQRAESSGIEFRYLMQADFVLFMRSEIVAIEWTDKWWPETLLYAGRHHGPFEIFARAISNKYFDRIKGLLTINQPSDLEPLMTSYAENKRDVPNWQFDRLNPAGLMGYSQLATKP